MNTETMDWQHKTHVSTSCWVASPVQGATPRLNMAIVQFNTGDENLQGWRWGMRWDRAWAYLTCLNDLFWLYLTLLGCEAQEAKAEQRACSLFTVGDNVLRVASFILFRRMSSVTIVNSSNHLVIIFQLKNNISLFNTKWQNRSQKQYFVV